MTKPGKCLPPQLFPTCMEWWWLLGTSTLARRRQGLCVSQSFPLQTEMLLASPLPPAWNVLKWDSSRPLTQGQREIRSTSASTLGRHKAGLVMVTDSWEEIHTRHWAKRSSWWAKNGKGRLSNASTLVQGGVSTVATVWTTLGTWHWKG